MPFWGFNLSTITCIFRFCFWVGIVWTECDIASFLKMCKQIVSSIALNISCIALVSVSAVQLLYSSHLSAHKKNKQAFQSAVKCILLQVFPNTCSPCALPFNGFRLLWISRKPVVPDHASVVTGGCRNLQDLTCQVFATSCHTLTNKRVDLVAAACVCVGA